MQLRFTDELTWCIVKAASAAPSIHNTQPWRFEAAGDELRLHAAPERALWVGDPGARALYLSCGAALFNARIAARVAGLDADVSLLPHPDYPFDVLAVIRARPCRAPNPAEWALYESVWRRHTDRRPYSSRQISPPLMAGLESSAQAEDASLRLLSRGDTSIVLRLAEAAGRELAADRAHQDELRRWMTDSAVEGIPRWALPIPPQRTPSPVRDTDFLAAAAEVRGTRVEYERHPQLTVLSTEHDEPEDWLRAGEALQHVLLVATLKGLSASFLYQVIERDDMHDDERIWPWPEHPQMIIRLGYGLGALPTPRRKLADLMQPAEYYRLTSSL